MKKKLSRLEAQFISIKLFEQFCVCSSGSVPSITGHSNYFDVSLHVKNKEDKERLCKELKSEFQDFTIGTIFLDHFKKYCIYVLIYFDNGK